MKAKKILWGLLAAAAITAGSFFGTLATNHSSAVHAESADTAKPTGPVDTSATLPAADLSRAFRTVHDSLKDAVVNISTTQSIRTAGGAGGNRIPEELRRMFPPGMLPFDPDNDGSGGGGGGGGGGGANPGAGRERVEGTGSGVIVSADGYVLTNNHVVENADTIVVRLDDGRELTAKTVGRDPKTDLAVVKVDANNLTYAKLGDSDAIEVGDWVLAFGSPFGFEQTMTQGIISAKGRQVNIIAEHNPALAGMTYENFLQTDAAINPGNSGGPLVNLKGEIIGVNTAIASRTGAYNGIGFSIPSNDVRYIMDSLIKNGKVVRGYLGVVISDVKMLKTRKVAESFGFKGNTGVLVEEARSDGPGAKGGLKAGDIITAINGKPVRDIGQLRTTIARTTPGTHVTLTVFREGKTQDLAFPVGTQPESIGPVARSSDNHATNAEPASAEAKDLGLTVMNIPDDVAEKLNIPTDKGVIVSAVDPDGIAADAGLRKGDVITNVHGKAVHSVNDFNAAIKSHKLSDGVRLSVRDLTGSERFVFVQKK